MLLAILGTEISPELVPADDGEPIQSTQAKIGPYALQDFTTAAVEIQGLPVRSAVVAADDRLKRMQYHCLSIEVSLTLQWYWSAW